MFREKMEEILKTPSSSIETTLTTTTATTTISPPLLNEEDIREIQRTISEECSNTTIIISNKFEQAMRKQLEKSDNNEIQVELKMKIAELEAKLEIIANENEQLKEQKGELLEFIQVSSKNVSKYQALIAHWIQEMETKIKNKS